MRKLNIICFILFFPLVMGFTQATPTLSAGCVHCLKMQQAQPDCCTTMSRGYQEMGGEKKKQDERDCPHSGLCEGDSESFLDVLPISSSYEIAIPLTYSFVTSEYPCIDNKTNKTGLSPLLKKPPPLFTLNCSFLI